MLQSRAAFLARSCTRPTQRLFSAIAYRRAEGDVSSHDGFSQRERAMENMYIRQKESERILRIKKLLAVQLEAINDLSENVEELLSEHNTGAGAGANNNMNNNQAKFGDKERSEYRTHEHLKPDDEVIAQR